MSVVLKGLLKCDAEGCTRAAEVEVMASNARNYLVDIELRDGLPMGWTPYFNEHLCPQHSRPADDK